MVYLAIINLRMIKGKFIVGTSDVSDYNVFHGSHPHIIIIST